MEQLPSLPQALRPLVWGQPAVSQFKFPPNCVLASSSLQDESEVEGYEKKFLEFLECFNRIANDQIAQIEQDKMYRDMVEQISGKPKRSKSVGDPSTDNELSSGSDKADASSEKKKELDSNTHQLVKFF